jgi:hypothetical protein
VNDEFDQPAAGTSPAGGVMTAEIKVERMVCYPGLMASGSDLGVHVVTDGRIGDEPCHITWLLPPALTDAATADLEAVGAAVEKATFELENMERRAGVEPDSGLRDDVDVVVALALRVRDHQGADAVDEHLRLMLQAYPPSVREALLRAAILGLAMETARAS